ncbi:MAG: ABC transporter ATP-binding protein [Candidatus Cloacimonetes bacterium]|nr:ABC transporter ATP-binding protein [Candidatus Cloacimonadota bacterium]
MNVVEINGLTKYYGKLKALDDIDLSLSEGRIIGLLGKNGAGKSTLMRCILGFLRFQGNIRVMGIPIHLHRETLHNHIAFIPDVNSLDNRLTVQQTLSYVANLNLSWNREKAAQLMARSDLLPDQKVGNLSKGMKTKLYLLITLSLDVKILLLDEPTLGLDIVFRKEFFNTILGEFYDESKTIVISTHQVEEVEHILQDIIFIDAGRIILNEDVNKLKESYKVLTVNADREEELRSKNPILVTRTLGNISAIVDNAVEIDKARISRPSLSDLFLARVGGYDEQV